MTRKAKAAPAADHPFQVGDAVIVAKENGVRVPVGSVGVIRQFSAAGETHRGNRSLPIVDVDGRGRVLMPMEALAPYDGAMPGATSKADPARVPLADTPQPTKFVPAPAAPVVDWCEAPDPALLPVRPPRPAWTPRQEAMAGRISALRNPESPAAQRGHAMTQEPAPDIPGQRNGWTAERRAKVRETWAKKREAKAAEQPAGATPSPAHTPETETAIATLNELEHLKETLSGERSSSPESDLERIVVPLHRPAEAAPLRVPTVEAAERDSDVLAVRITIAAGATRGMSSRSIAELARLLVELDGEEV
jgi:hypothetical protein